MNAEDVALFLLFSACAAGFGAAAKKYGGRVGIPPALVPLVGGALLAIMNPPSRRR